MSQLKKDNRVLSRWGARQLNHEEIKKIYGGIATATVCSAPSPYHPKGDGDPGEC